VGNAGNLPFQGVLKDLTCKRGSVGQGEGMLLARSSVQFRLKPENSNSHRFELHRPSIKGTQLLLKVIKAIIIKQERKAVFGVVMVNMSAQRRWWIDILAVLKRRLSESLICGVFGTLKITIRA